MKPTSKQLEVIREIKSIVGCWEGTNDMSSPTHFVDIEDFIRTLDLDENIETELINRVQDLFNSIKNIK